MNEPSSKEAGDADAHSSFQTSEVIPKYENHDKQIGFEEVTVSDEAPLMDWRLADLIDRCFG